MGIVGIVVGITVVWILFSLPLYMALMALLISLPCAVFINYLGILLDLKFPKLNWDNEQSGKAELKWRIDNVYKHGFRIFNFYQYYY